MTTISTDRHADGRHYAVVDILKSAGYSTAIVSGQHGKFTIETDAPASYAVSAAKTIGVRGVRA